MRTYIFTYFAKLDGDEYISTHKFEVPSKRFSQAFSIFLTYYRSLPGIKDFSYTYICVGHSYSHMRRLQYNDVCKLSSSSDPIFSGGFENEE